MFVFVNAGSLDSEDEVEEEEEAGWFSEDQAESGKEETQSG